MQNKFLNNIWYKRFFILSVVLILMIPNMIDLYNKEQKTPVSLNESNSRLINEIEYN